MSDPQAGKGPAQEEKRETSPGEKEEKQNPDPLKAVLRANKQELPFSERFPGGGALGRDGSQLNG